MTTRNNDGMYVARGREWRYQRTSADESVAVRTDERWQQQDDGHPLYDIGGSIVERERATETGQRHVVSKVQNIDA